MTFLEVASMVVTWWIVAVLRSDITVAVICQYIFTNATFPLRMSLFLHNVNIFCFKTQHCPNRETYLMAVCSLASMWHELFCYDPEGMGSLVQISSNM